MTGRRNGAAGALVVLLVAVAAAGWTLVTLFPDELQQVGDWARRSWSSLIK